MTTGAIALAIAHIKKFPQGMQFSKENTLLWNKAIGNIDADRATYIRIKLQSDVVVLDVHYPHLEVSTTIRLS